MTAPGISAGLDQELQDMSSVYADADFEREAHRTSDELRRTKAFRVARRHTVLVRVLRLLLPGAGVALIISLFVLARAPTVSDFDSGILRTTVLDDSIVMESPKLTGFDSDNREYRVSATRATQKLNNPDAVRLDDIEATILAEGWGESVITANGGDYDNSTKMLKLFGGIEMNSSKGYGLRMKNADIDFNTGALVTPNPVTISYQGSELSGDNLEITNRGKCIVIEQNVRTTLMPPKREKASDLAETAPIASGDTQSPQPLSAVDNGSASETGAAGPAELVQEPVKGRGETQCEFNSSAK